MSWSGKLPTDNKLKISIKYGEIEASYKIAERIAPEIYSKIKNILDPSKSADSPEIEI